ncbi:Translation initiation factor IF-3 [Candidatus Hodgkinia cicadicola]|uniref:Translation initiation factor IF-3 n=1 Tax=Candidatus Hodgkinia cicadicola TaxID=573658 RepID=A0ABX4MG64_9HYPH|nr:Translation initiation factor IF-3 [Candidatus Hodgkinia cicadicola]
MVRLSVLKNIHANNHQAIGLDNQCPSLSMVRHVPMPLKIGSPIDIGKRKYLKKKELSKLRMVGRMVSKHIDIKSNIGGNDLEVKLRTISGFYRKGFRTDVLVKHSRSTTSLEAYASFLNMLSTRLRTISSNLVGPTPTDHGNNTFVIQNNG